MGFVARRTLGGIPRLRSSSRIFCRQSCRLRYWLRDSLLTTTMPVGRWRMRTAESAVLTPCPPGPVAWNASASQSLAIWSSDWRPYRA